MRRADAHNYLTEIEAAKLSGSYLDPTAGRLTFNQWADRWWQVWAAADPDRSRPPWRPPAAGSAATCARASAGAGSVR
jgi:hypothetical protein